MRDRLESWVMGFLNLDIEPLPRSGARAAVFIARRKTRKPVPAFADGQGKRT